ncbi:hypothetical protein AB0M23_05675 [Streptomyces sp. NPDC052077]|uniref:TetR/AcrR family transcriptional regulator n=1 Tax=Streptomyces sp. NPDC052077 TaxID=3154757 RepID=UPI0034382724
MTPGDLRNPHGTGHVIDTVRALMRTGGLGVSLAAVARASGTSRGFLYANWKSASALHVRALRAELGQVFDAARRTRPSDGTVPGIVSHLTEAVRLVRRHPTTAAVARTDPAALLSSHTALDGPVLRTAAGLIGDLLHPLAPHGGVWSDPRLDSRPWKLLWIARPAALCPGAVGDPAREEALDGLFGELALDLLAPWADRE